MENAISTEKEGNVMAGGGWGGGAMWTFVQGYKGTVDWQCVQPPSLPIVPVRGAVFEICEVCHRYPLTASSISHYFPPLWSPKNESSHQNRVSAAMSAPALFFVASETQRWSFNLFNLQLIVLKFTLSVGGVTNKFLKTNNFLLISNHFLC